MRLLLTSAGITNPTLKKELASLAIKPLSELKAVFIPTAATAAAEDKSWLIKNFWDAKNCDFAEIDIVDINATSPSFFIPRIEAADVIFMGGGNTFYLMQRITAEGIDKKLPNWLEDKTYIGISAGSMLLCPRLDIPDNELLYPGEDNPENISKGLGLIDFCVLPHYNSDYFTSLREEAVTKAAKEMAMPTYAIDDETAIKIDGKKLDIVGEGKHLFIA